MKIYEDTRQKIGKHENIKAYCDKVGVEIIPKCLEVGDYQLVGGGRIAIDTKASLNELAKDLIEDEILFNRKYSKAYNNNIRLIILIEDSNYIVVNDVLRWENPNKRCKKQALTGKGLYDKMRKLELSYGIRFIFCNKKNTGAVIISILSHELNGSG